MPIKLQKNSLQMAVGHWISSTNKLELQVKNRFVGCRLVCSKVGDRTAATAAMLMREQTVC
jgi:hypothetical protein